MASRQPRHLGKARDIADRNIELCRKTLKESRGDVDIVNENLNKWLDYREKHEKAGTLDEEQYL